jgi:hypothetical protein
VHTASVALCDDGVSCTFDACDPDAGCSYTADDAQCDDGNVCTLDLCDPLSDCEWAPLPGPCDDGDECTEGDFCVGGECEPGEDACEPIVPWCIVTGSSGATVDCQFRVAAASLAQRNVFIGQATGMEAGVQYDPSALGLVNFYALKCFPSYGCFDLAATGSGATTLPGGHTLSIYPSNTSLWNGNGGMVIANFSNPQAAISPAYLAADGATITGDPLVLKMRFTLKKNLPSGTPVLLNGVLGANANTIGLKTLLRPDGLIVTSLN